jgi:hypothetical protein
VISVVPTLTPVTTPKDDTVATRVFDDVHVASDTWRLLLGPLLIHTPSGPDVRPTVVLASPRSSKYGNCGDTTVTKMEDTAPSKVAVTSTNPGDTARHEVPKVPSRLRTEGSEDVHAA